MSVPTDLTELDALSDTLLEPIIGRIELLARAVEGSVRPTRDEPGRCDDFFAAMVVAELVALGRAVEEADEMLRRTANVARLRRDGYTPPTWPVGDAAGEVTS